MNRLKLFALTTSLITTNAMASDEIVLKESQNISIWSTISNGGIIGFIIIGISVIATALIIDNLLRIRRNKMIPSELLPKIEKAIIDKDYEVASELCKKENTFLTKVIEAGLLQHSSVLGYYDMQNAMQEESERYISKLLRRIDYISFIGSATPMLGLLGTVTGMIKAFNQIALTEGSAKASELAGGISEALITTCLGLIVAIPAMFFVTFLRNRIDGYVAEAEPIVDHIMRSFKNDESRM